MKNFAEKLISSLADRKLGVTVLVILLGMVGLVSLSCSLESGGNRHIRGHDHAKSDIYHAEPAQRAERYCRDCHGANLAGGPKGEPSCYKCHGQNWTKAGTETVFATAEHTERRGKFLHHRDIATPLATCTSCHGSDLKGTGPTGTPSCFLCHDKVWD